MLNRNFPLLVVASCLCGVGGFGLSQAWADTSSMASPGAALNAAADVNAGQSGSGARLKLPPDSNQAQAADAAAAPAVAMDKPLATVKRKTMGQPRLGRALGAGMASWYGRGFQGRRTASGERFDRHALTAAHKTLPLGTRVAVRNPRTGRQIVVRINDRGPYTGNRVLDLSEAAASALGIKARGHGWVVMHAVLPSPAAPDATAYAVAQTPHKTAETQPAESKVAMLSTRLPATVMSGLEMASRGGEPVLEHGE